MDILNFGSLNIDHVYRVPHFVQPGETLSSESYIRNAGGKGLNQSVALARAGVAVRHAGKIGADGAFLVDVLREAGADVSGIMVGETPTGHAIIQVVPSGQNDILLYPGANHALTHAEINAVLDGAPAGSWLLLQNEINDIPFILRAAHERGLHIAINPAPCGPEVLDYPLEWAELLFVNEIEGATLAGCTSDSTPTDILSALTRRWPNVRVVLTLGGDGAYYAHGDTKPFFAPAERVIAVDTTSAGDTFCGYFLAAMFRGYDPRQSMAFAAHAAAVTVSRPGAAVSIPHATEIFPQ